MKTIIVVGVILFLIVYGVTKSVNTLDADINVNHSFEEKTILSEDESLKKEMLDLFPHFIKMKAFVKENFQEDDILLDKILSTIETVESDYISGGLTEKSAKKALSDF